MSVEITGRSAKLSAYLHIVESVELAAQTIAEHAYFLAQTGRGGGLAVGLGKHRYVGPFVGQRVELCDELRQHRAIHISDCLLDRHRHRSVVDILRRQSEMYEFLVGLKSETVKLLLDEIFHRLYVVVGDRLDLLDALGIGHAEVSVDGAQSRKQIGIYSCKRRQRYAAQSDEILYLYTHPVAYQGIFREILVEGFRL